MTGHRLDDFSRRAAGPKAGGDTTIDALSRVLSLGRPVSRRRAIGVLGGALVAGHVARALPALGQGARCPKSSDPAATKECTKMVDGGVAFVCVRPELPCCNSDRCAVACSQPWKVCRNEGSATAACDDTAAMCAPDSTAPRVLFCDGHGAARHLHRHARAGLRLVLSRGGRVRERTQRLHLHG